jgi:hypothetical protein
MGSKGGQLYNRKEQDMRANRHGVMVKKAVAALGFLVISTTAGRVFGQPPWGGPGPGLPPEAIQACEGKNSGDAVQFQTPRGDTITGTCREMQGQLVAVPQK